MIVLGEALSMSSAERDVAPLLFFRGAYSRLAEQDDFEAPVALQSVG